MLNEVIQANDMDFMNFWYIEYGACFGDGIDAKMICSSCIGLKCALF